MAATEVLHKPSRVAKIIGKAQKTLANMRHLGTGPRFRKIGTTILYPDSELQLWLRSRVFTCAAESKPKNQARRRRQRRAA